jgi:hypothetical protein
MPVILPERDYSRWLDVDSPQLPIQHISEKKRISKPIIFHVATQLLDENIIFECQST